MNFNNLIRLANKNEVQTEKKRSTLKPGLPPLPPSTSKNDAKPAKGINSAAVRAVLAEQERLEKEKSQKPKQKPSAATKDAASAPKAPPSKPCLADDDLDCDLKKLFNKNSKRVALVPDSAIPNMLEVLKKKEKLRKQKEKEEDEERIKRERDLLRERGEREREKQREEKEKTHHHHSSDSSSKHKHRSHRSDEKSFASSTSADGKSNGSSRPAKFKIPKKPPISYDDILALAAKKQGEPETAAAASAIPVVKKPVAQDPKSEPSRLMTQAEKDRWNRINSEEYQNWLKNGGPPPQNLPQTSKGRKSSSLSKDKASSNSQLDRRKSGREELVGSRSEKPKTKDKSPSPDRGRTADRPGPSNGQAKASDRSQSNGHIGQNSARNSTSQPSSVRNSTSQPSSVRNSTSQPSSVRNSTSQPSSARNSTAQSSSVRSSTAQPSADRSNRVEATGSHLSESQRKSKSADQANGSRKEEKSSEANRSIKPSSSQKDLPVKSVVNAKNVDVCKSNPSVNKRPPQDSQRLKSNGNDTKASNSGTNSTAGGDGGGGGGGGGVGKEQKQIMKDFYIQCKKLKESGFLSDSLLKSLESELIEKLKSLRKGDSSKSGKPNNASGNNSKPSSDKLSAKPSASHSHQNTSKVMPSSGKVKSSVGIGSSSSGSGLKREEKSSSKPVSVWDKICAENRQFKPKIDPAVLKRRLEEVDSEEEDDEDDEYDEDDDDDMDDFIDDGEDESGIDYTSYIRSMTKYDPTKYDDDFDDRNMETSYAQVLKEEAYSAREGRREDIEDIVMEEEENRRKLLKKKAGAKRPRFS